MTEINKSGGTHKKLRLSVLIGVIVTVSLLAGFGVKTILGENHEVPTAMRAVQADGVDQKNFFKSDVNHACATKLKDQMEANDGSYETLGEFGITGTVVHFSDDNGMEQTVSADEIDNLAASQTIVREKLRLLGTSIQDSEVSEMDDSTLLVVSRDDSTIVHISSPRCVITDVFISPDGWALKAFLKSTDWMHGAVNKVRDPFNPVLDPMTKIYENRNKIAKGLGNKGLNGLKSGFKYGVNILKKKRGVPGGGGGSSANKYTGSMCLTGAPGYAPNNLNANNGRSSLNGQYLLQPGQSRGVRYYRKGGPRGWYLYKTGTDWWIADTMALFKDSHGRLSQTHRSGNGEILLCGGPIHRCASYGTWWFFHRSKGRRLKKIVKIRLEPCERCMKGASHARMNGEFSMRGFVNGENWYSNGLQRYYFAGRWLVSSLLGAYPGYCRKHTLVMECGDIRPGVSPATMAARCSKPGRWIVTYGVHGAKLDAHAAMTSGSCNIVSYCMSGATDSRMNGEYHIGGEVHGKIYYKKPSTYGVQYYYFAHRWVISSMLGDYPWHAEKHTMIMQCAGTRENCANAGQWALTNGVRGTSKQHRAKIKPGWC